MHHTKAKADKGLARVIADVVDKGGTPCIPLSEHQPYDLYCPEKNKVLYVLNSVDCPKAIRFDRPANNQSKNVKWANAYLKL